MTNDPADQYAQEIARRIAARPKPDPRDLNYRVSYLDAGQPPTDVETIKKTLLAGEFWTSWLDDGTVTDAMRLMFGPPYTHEQGGWR